MKNINETDYELLTRILDEEVVYYTDKANCDSVYVEYPNYNGNTSFVSISSRKFQNFVVARYAELSETDTYPDFTDAIKTRTSVAAFKTINPVIITNRVFGSISSGKITYDLASETDKPFVVIKEDGVSLKSTTKNFKFLRNATDKAQVTPTEGTDSDVFTLLTPYINMDESSLKLFVIHLIQLFSRSSSHFATIISSSKGTGKTTLTKLVSSLIAPSEIDAVVTSNSDSDLKTTLAGNYFVAFDNTTALSTSYSNILCAAITGSKEAKRKLYTDSDKVILTLHSAVFINGIDIVPHQSDLAERSLLFELQPITHDKRIPEREFWDRFDADKPVILSAIFHTLSKAMTCLKDIKTEKLHRMAEANKEMLAIAVALGITEEEFQTLLDGNRNTMDEKYSENSTFVDTIVDFIAVQGSQRTFASALYSAVKDFYDGQPSLFPGSASQFSRKLEQEREALQKCGITVIRSKDSKTNCTIIELISPNFPQKKKRSDGYPCKKVNSLLENAND